MEMFKAAAAAFMPGVEQAAGDKPAEKPAAAPKDEALETLKAQMAAMQKKLDELGK
jgi:polyhydroxyalkanoate synthesis regulator protein